MIGTLFGFIFVWFFFVFTNATTAAITEPDFALAELSDSYAAALQETASRDADSLPLVVLEQQFDHREVFPQQPVELSVHLYIKDAPGNSAGLDPFSRIAVYQRERVPLLDIPWADDKSVPENLLPLQSWEHWIKTVPIGRVGFSLNRFSTRPGVSRVNIFLPTVEKTVRKNDSGEEALYWKYTIRRHFIAKKSGMVLIPAAHFSGPVLALIEEESTTSRNGITSKTEDSDAPDHDAPKAVTKKSRIGVQNVNTACSSIVLTVLDIPQENRPENYVGIFGVFQWNVDIQPRQAKVGEPMMLTIAFFGDGSIVNAKAPDLSQIPEIVGKFKVYPAKEELDDNTIRYTYLLRPKKQGDLVFPKISVSYFNTETQQYQTLESSPVVTTVLPTEPGNDFALRSESGDSHGGSGIVLTESGIFDNFKNIDSLKNQKVKPKTYFFFIAFWVVLYAGIVFYVFASRIQKPVSLKEKRETAIEHAKKRFTDISDLLAMHKFSESCVQVQNILIQFIASIHGLSSQKMTPREAIQLVRNWKLTETQIEELGDLFEHLTALRYGTTTLQKAANAVNKGEIILEDLIAALPALYHTKKKL